MYSFFVPFTRRPLYFFIVPVFTVENSITYINALLCVFIYIINNTINDQENVGLTKVTSLWRLSSESFIKPKPATFMKTKINFSLTAMPVSPEMYSYLYVF